MSKKALIFWATVIGLVFCVIGYIYSSHTAGNLPKFFPGYQAGDGKVHGKHSLAAFVVAAVFFVYAWFKSKPEKSV